MPHDALMLPFCRAIKHRSVLHVDAVRGLGTESLEHVLLLRMESSPGQSAQRRKRSTDTGKVKQNWRALRFECLLLSFAFIAQNKCDDSAKKNNNNKNKSSSLSELESVIIQDNI